MGEPKKRGIKQREALVSGRVYGFNPSRAEEGSIPRHSRKTERAGESGGGGGAIFEAADVGWTGVCAF